MRLCDILSPDRVLWVEPEEDKWALLRRLVECLTASQPAFPVDAEAILECVQARERELSTGLEAGLAVPHGLLAQDLPTLAALALAPQGLDFEALDGQPTQIVVLLVASDGPEGRRRHLLLLSRLSRLFADARLRERLLASADADELLSQLGSAELDNNY
ncbi:MAG: PTS sugar transporter subunit IIA [Planctomycetes bacterium]|nr:PTS sugar transporter subunit IIA [Planctomycetota bacterium]